MSKKSVVYLNGKYVKVSAGRLEAFTPGIFQGDGVFETMLAVGGKVFDVQAHLKRLKASFKNAGITEAIIQETLKLNRLDLARVRVLVWKHQTQVHRMVMAIKYEMPKIDEYKVCVIKTKRKANARLANIKSLDYSLFADAYAKAKAKGFDEALLLNDKGYVFEASRANVFTLKNGQLITPPLSSGCLSGITRRQVIKTAKKMGVKVLERNLTVADIRSAQEVFVTNSLIGIKPIKLSSIVLPR